MIKVAGFLVLTLGPTLPVQASPFDIVWQEFKQRCLERFEDFQTPLVDDLSPVSGREGAFQLPKGALLVLSGSDDLGTRSCAVQGVGLMPGFEQWVTQAQQSGLYRESETPGQWLSHEWIEPRILIEKTDGAIRVVETDLEA